MLFRSTNQAQPSLSRSGLQLVTTAEKEMAALGDQFISTEHLLIAATADSGPVRSLLGRNGVTRDGLLAALPEVRGGRKVTSENPEDTFQALEKYGTDLTAARPLSTLRAWIDAPGSRYE